MPNPYKEAEKNKKTPPGSRQGGAETEEKVTQPSVPETKAEKPTEPVAALADLLGTIGEEKKPARRSASLYLSDSNLAELKKRSKAAGLSASEYLDQLLTKIFG